MPTLARVPENTEYRSGTIFHLLLELREISNIVLERFSIFFAAPKFMRFLDGRKWIHIFRTSLSHLPSLVLWSHDSTEGLQHAVYADVCLVLSGLEEQLSLFISNCQEQLD